MPKAMAIRSVHDMVCVSVSTTAAVAFSEFATSWERIFSASVAIGAAVSRIRRLAWLSRSPICSVNSRASVSGRPHALRLQREDLRVHGADLLDDGSVLILEPLTFLTQV